MASPPLVLVFCGFPINGSQVSRRDGMSYYHRHHLEHHHHHLDHVIIVIMTMMIMIIVKCLASVVAWWNVLSQHFKLFIQTQRHILLDTEAHIFRQQGIYLQVKCHIMPPHEPTHIFYNQTQWIVSFEHQKEAQKINLYCFQSHKIGKAHQWKVKIRLVLC